MAEIFIGKNSGFVSYKTSSLSLSMNVHGYQSIDKDFDLRLSAGSPFWLSYKGQEILSAFSNYSPIITSAGTRFPFGSSLGYIIDNLKSRKHYASNNVGYIPYISTNGFSYCFTDSSHFNYHRSGVESLMVEFEGQLKRFDTRFFSVLFKSLKWVLNAWINPRKAKNRKYLISDTPFLLKRNLLIGKDYIFFNDSFENITSLKRFIIPFTLRTAEEYSHYREEENFFIINSLSSTIYFCVEKFPGEELILKKRLHSSTGISNYWEVRSKSKTSTSLDGRLVFLCEEADTSTINNKFKAYANQVQLDLAQGRRNRNEL